MAVLAFREKSPEAFRTISEVATELDMPQHVLRFWESRFSQVRPIKRAGGRRYYRPEDVDLLRGIRALLYREGFTIKGAQKILREKGPRHVMELGRVTAVTSFEPAAIEAPADVRSRMTLTVIERAGDESRDVVSSLAHEERVRLGILLAELVQLKKRLRAARTPRTA
jgi:DNA-binding transcriptional MerR regulator